MKTRQAILLLCIIAVAIGAFFLRGYIGKSVVVLRNGSIITADETWQSGAYIFYEIEGEVFSFNRFEVESFGDADLEFFARQIKNKLFSLFVKTNSEFKNFASDTSDSVSQNVVWVIGILAVTSFCIIVLLAVHLIMGLRQTKEPAAQHQRTPKLKVIPDEDSEDDITRSNITDYFLNLFRLQIGADPQAEMETKSLSENSSGPNYVYELRIKHRGDWVKRRMTIGPLGEDAGSKSKCFYVIYDVHLVLKIGSHR
jgi:hypothetical protein